MGKGHFYNEERIKARKGFFSNDSSSEYINNLFFREIKHSICKGNKVLDVGTGNGYIVEELIKRFPELSLDIYGSDNSKDMILEARRRLPRPNFVLGDNYSLPFSGYSFDLVTAKNVTRFSPNEVYRVLKKGGLFIFREYGEGKGLVEIAKLFPKRLIRARPPIFYVNSFKKIGFEEVNLEQYRLFRDYSVEQVIDVITMFPFVNNYSIEDENKIREFYNKKSKINITSDPIIITGKKSK